MYWKITCYNGTVWIAPYQMDLTEALEWFHNDTKLLHWDIKLVENLH